MKQEKPHIVITGTTKGLGNFLCRQLLLEGYTVTGLARSLIREEFESDVTSGSYQHIAADLSDLNNIDLVYSEILSKQTRYLIINAADYSSLENLTGEGFLQQLNLNLVFPSLIIQKLISNKLQSPLKIIFISSIMAEIYDGKSPMYGAAKLAMTHFIGGLQLQNHPNLTFLRVTVGPLNNGKQKSLLRRISSSSFDKTSRAIISNLTTEDCEIFIPYLWQFVIYFKKLVGIQSSSNLINNCR